MVILTTISYLQILYYVLSSDVTGSETIYSNSSTLKFFHTILQFSQFSELLGTSLYRLDNILFIALFVMYFLYVFKLSMHPPMSETELTKDTRIIKRHFLVRLKKPLSRLCYVIITIGIIPTIQISLYYITCEGNFG